MGFQDYNNKKNWFYDISIIIIKNIYYFNISYDFLMTYFQSDGSSIESPSTIYIGVPEIHLA